jgi:hypothetical protein
MSVVVIGVLIEDQPQVPLAGDEHLIQALAAGTGDSPLGDRVRPRTPRRELHYLDPGAGHYRVEFRDELPGPVAN